MVTAFSFLTQLEVREYVDWEGSLRYVGTLITEVRGYVGWEGSERGVMQPSTENTPSNPDP